MFSVGSVPKNYKGYQKTRKGISGGLSEFSYVWKALNEKVSYKSASEKKTLSVIFEVYNSVTVMKRTRRKTRKYSRIFFCQNSVHRIVTHVFK